MKHFRKDRVMHNRAIKPVHCIKTIISQVSVKQTPLIPQINKSRFANCKIKISICNAIVGILSLVCATQIFADLSTLSKNDPYPMFRALDPHDFLYTHKKLSLKDPEFADLKYDHVGIGISPFAQNAFHATNYRGNHSIGNIPVEIGDITGRWGMVGLLFGPAPQGQSFPPILINAMNILYPGMTPGTINDPTIMDPNQLLGFFSVPVKYRKRGVRFDLTGNIMCGFGLNLQTGVASLSQTVTAFNDLTCLAQSGCPQTVPNLTGFTFTTAQQTNIENTLMRQCDLREIAHQIGFNLHNYDTVSIEEIRLNLFWRQAYELNKGLPQWPHLLVMPFFELSASFSPGKIAEPSHAFAAPYGNNGHNAVGFTAGIEFDFFDTIEIGAEVGAVHFFPRDFCNYRIPTNPCQIGIFPFATAVKIKPGMNVNFTAQMAAYHFLDNLSFYFQYVMIEHKKNEITLRAPDPVFLVEKAEQTTDWKAKLINTSFMYDISPNIGLGILWQIPISQRNTYQSTTFMITFYATI